jgi:precorrin-6A/cobalt-precorrin-6A reductase
MSARKRHLLILGGTAEARILAERALAQFGSCLEITTSLAGRTAHHAVLPGAVRSGGFGGSVGLVRYLHNAQVDFVIDATHPFARQISAAAVAACRAISLPLLALARPAWRAQEDDRWVEVADATEAAAQLAALSARRVLLTIGQRDLQAFAALSDIHFVVRLIDPPTAPLPFSSATLLLGRPPSTADEERLMMQAHAVDAVVTKASGGAVPAKLIAARALSLLVIMLRRPLLENEAEVACVEDALDWIARRLDRVKEALP